MDGVEHSDTYLLEREFEWGGILAEPQKECEERLKLNRRCEIDTRAVYSESGKTLDFFQQGHLVYQRWLRTIIQMVRTQNIDSFQIVIKLIPFP